MTDKEKRIFEEWFEEKKEKCEVYGNGDDFWVDDEIKKFCLMGYELGLKAGRPQWHKVADGDLPKGEDGFGKNGIHRNIYLKDRYGNLYTGNYFSKDDTHKEDCFAVEFLEWGFQGSHFCAKEQISEWCEIPTFDKE